MGMQGEANGPSGPRGNDRGGTTADRSLDADLKYARGDTTRDQWLTERQGAAARPPASSPPPPKPLPLRRLRPLPVLLVAVGVVLAVAFLWAATLLPSNVPPPSYSSTARLGPSDLAALNATAGGLAFPGNGSVWLGPGAVTLVVYLSPPAQDMAFQVLGLRNPTIHAVAGSRITVVAVNMDGDLYHNWALSTQGPPYTSMPMMGGGMMNTGTMMSMVMLGPASATGFWSQRVSFTAASGTYWYLCTVYNHAAGGMYGSFLVS